METRITSQSAEQSYVGENDPELIPDVQISTREQMPLDDIMNGILDMEEDYGPMYTSMKGPSDGQVVDPKVAKGFVQSKEGASKKFARKLSTFTDVPSSPLSKSTVNEKMFVFSLPEYIKNYFAMNGKEFSPSNVIQLSDLNAATLSLGIKWKNFNGILKPVETVQNNCERLIKQNDLLKIEIPDKAAETDPIDTSFFSESSCLSVKADANTCTRGTGTSPHSLGAILRSGVSGFTSGQSEVTFVDKSNIEKELRPTIGHASSTYASRRKSSQQGNSLDADKTNIGRMEVEMMHNGESTATMHDIRIVVPNYKPATRSTTRDTTAKNLTANRKSPSSFAARKSKSPYEHTSKIPNMSDLPSDHPT